MANRFDQLGNALRWMRNQKGLRQSQLADQAGLTKAMVSAYEVGKQRPTLDNLDRLLTALDAGLGDLEQALAYVERGRIDGSDQYANGAVDDREGPRSSANPPYR